MVVPELRFSHPFQYNCLRLNQLTVTPLRYVLAYGSAEILVRVGLYPAADATPPPCRGFAQFANSALPSCADGRDDHAKTGNGSRNPGC